MLDSQQILGVIERRLVEAGEEIAALEAARAALGGSAQTNRSARRARGRSRGVRRVRVSRSVPRPAPSNGATSVAVATAPEAAAAARPALSARAPRTRALPDGAIESLLSEKADGLSAAALSKLTGAGYARVTARLRDLEQGGKVKSSGARRTSLWRMVTDEERIAERGHGA